LLLLVVAVLPLYLAFRSVSLDDFDSYSFGLALERFDLALQQPQPPGFPIYVFLGRAFLSFVGEPTAALTLLSALGGTLAALALYGLGRAMSAGCPLAGAGAALLVGLVPMGWLTAEKALSDAPGLALTLLSLWLLWLGRDDPRRLALGALVSGLGLGVRLQDGLPVLLLLAGLTVCRLRSCRVARTLIWVVLPFLLGVLVWLLPTLHAAGGLSAYVGYLSAHSAHVRQTDSFLAAGLPPVEALRARGLAFGDTFLMHTVGIGLHGRWGWGEVARGLALALVTVPGLALAGWRRRPAWLLAAWAALTAAQIFFLEALDRPRLMLPLLPPLALLVVRGWARLRHPRFLAPALLTAASFGLLLQGVPLAAQLTSVPAPSAQAAAYVADRYPPAETLVAAAGSFRAVQVELPAYRTFYLYEFGLETARAAIDDGVAYVAVFDRDQFPDGVMAVLSGDGRYAPLEERTFARDPRVHTQYDQVRLQVLTPADRLPPEALAPPPGGCIDVGGAEGGRYLDRGWYRPEEIGGVAGRWAGSTLTTTVRLYLEPGHDYRLTLHALAYPADQEVVVRMNGQTLARLPLAQTWEEHATVIPAVLLSSGETVTVELVHARMTSPFVETGGASSDRRSLSAAYSRICLAVER